MNNVKLVPHRYLATGDAIKTIAYNFRMGVSTARQIVLDVCTALWDALASIHMPIPSEVEWESIAEDFFARWNFPNCIGAIDGKHVMIQCPVNSGSLFYNYKSYFSIVLLAVASADYRFVMVDIGAYGSSNDSGVLNNTALFKCLKKKKLGIPPSKQLPNDTKETRVPHVLLGDEAFPLRCDMMRPFARNTLTNERAHLQLPIVQGKKSSGNGIWYFGQPMENFPPTYLPPSRQCHYSCEGKQFYCTIYSQCLQIKCVQMSSIKTGPKYLMMLFKILQM